MRGSVGKQLETTTKLKKNQYIVLAYVIGLTLISLLYVNSQTPIAAIVAVAITLMALVSLGTDYSIPLVIAAYQFTYWVPYIYITLIVLVYYLIKHTRKIQIFNPVLWYFLVVLLSSISLSMPGASLDHFLRTVISQLAIVFLFTTNTDKDIDIISIKTFCSGFFLKTIVMFFVAQKYSSIDYILQTRFGYGEMMRFLPEWLVVQNENSYATFSVLTITLLYILRHMKNENNINHVLYFLGITLAVILGLITKSRTFVITGIIFILFVLSMKSEKNIIRKLSSIVISLIIIFGGYLVVKRFMPTVYNGIISRFMYSDLSNGRFEIFSIINERFFSGSSKGLMFGYLAVKDYGDILGFIDAFHNVIQKAYVLHGFVGFSVIICFLVSYFRFNKQWNNRPLDLMFILPFIIALSAGLASNPDLIVYVFGIYLISMNYHGEIQET